jgi:malate dehydrogenase (oxaloacetate-decarboxylating)(NADP+)
VGATTINEEMKLACVYALAKLAQKETTERVLQAYGGEPERFGSEYLIPKPFDPRLMTELAPAVALAAMQSGVATRPIENMHTYREKLKSFVHRTGFFMRPVLERAIGSGKRLVYADGESQRVLQAVQQIVDDDVAKPILLGDPEIINKQIIRLGLRIRTGVDVEVIDPHHNPMYDKHWRYYHALLGRKGVTPASAQELVKTQSSILAALMVACGDADSMISGVIGGFQRCTLNVLDIIGKAPGVQSASTLMAHILPSHTVFICDAHIKPDPTAEEIAEMAILCADEIEAFGIKPKIALLSHSSFGLSHHASAEKMREALRILHDRAPQLEADGEMQADAALSVLVRQRLFPDSQLRGAANLLVMPNIDAANIAVNLLRMLGGGVNVGPILVGTQKSAHVMTQSSSVRALVNMSAIAIENVLRNEKRSQAPL